MPKLFRLKPYQLDRLQRSFYVLSTAPRAVQTLRNASRGGGYKQKCCGASQRGREFALALRNAGMSAYEQVDLLTLYRDEKRKYYKIEIYFFFYPIIIIN